jgi:hypothetical protein
MAVEALMVQVVAVAVAVAQALPVQMLLPQHSQMAAQAVQDLNLV